MNIDLNSNEVFNITSALRSAVNAQLVNICTNPQRVLDQDSGLLDKIELLAKFGHIETAENFLESYEMIVSDVSSIARNAIDPEIAKTREVISGYASDGPDLNRNDNISL